MTYCEHVCVCVCVCVITEPLPLTTHTSSKYNEIINATHFGLFLKWVEKVQISKSQFIYAANFDN